MQKLHPYLLLGLTLLLLSAASASYWIYSNVVTVTVGSYTLTLQTSTGSPIQYHNVTLTAILKDQNNNPVSGGIVYFMVNNNVSIGQGTTNPSGVASLQYNCTTPSQLQFQAKYAVP